MRSRIRNLVALCALVLALSALAPSAIAKTTSVFPGEKAIKYYAVFDGTSFVRSTTPFASGVATQRVDGHTVTFELGPHSGYADSGFVVGDWKLADLPSFELEGTGSEYSVNLYFDRDANGEFFTWSGDVYSGPGGDTYGLGPSSANGSESVSGSTPFFMMTAPNPTCTIDQLKAGAFPGISADTTVAIWVGVNSVDTTKSATITISSSNVSSETVAGPSRIDTAIEASKRMYPDADTHADAVIITNGYNWPDALSGASLAGVMNAPVLLNAAPPSAMPKPLDAEVVRLKDNGATEAYILGDTPAVGPAVEARLLTIFGGTSKVHRLGRGGHSRYATSLDIADTVIGKKGLGAGWDGTVFLARGTDFPDALAASPLSAKNGWPIVLAEDDGHGGLSARVKGFLAAQASKVIILGSTRAVPSAVETAVIGAVGAGKIDRWYGADRIATAIDVADHSVADGMSYDGIGVATGWGFADALCGGPYLAKKNNPLLLTAYALPLRPALDAKLPELSPAVATVRFLGGTPVPLPQDVRDAIVDKLR